MNGWTPGHGSHPSSWPGLSGPSIAAPAAIGGPDKPGHDEYSAANDGEGKPTHDEYSAATDGEGKPTHDGDRAAHDQNGDP
jgi:hypothetical protein